MGSAQVADKRSSEQGSLVDCGCSWLCTMSPKPSVRQTHILAHLTALSLMVSVQVSTSYRHSTDNSCIDSSVGLHLSQWRICDRNCRYPGCSCIQTRSHFYHYLCHHKVGTSYAASWLWLWWSWQELWSWSNS
jgi:hypothetical protein